MQDASMRARKNVISRIGAHHTRSSTFQERLFKRPKACLGRANQGKPAGCGRSYLGTAPRQRCSCRRVTAGRTENEHCSNTQASETDTGADVFPSAGYAEPGIPRFFAEFNVNLIRYVVLEMHIKELVPCVWEWTVCAQMPGNATELKKRGAKWQYQRGLRNANETKRGSRFAGPPGESYRKRGEGREATQSDPVGGSLQRRR